MHPYRLEPSKAHLNSPHWKLSTIGAVGCTVLANDPRDARERVTLATIIAARARLGDESPSPPWKDETLTSCERDDSLSCGPDEIRTSDGRSIPIED
jgi:hypothetical protein